MLSVTEELAIKTELSFQGYRFIARDFEGNFEYSSDWFQLYKDLFIERNLFALSAKIASAEMPMIIADFDSDEILNYNYKAKILFNLSKSVIPTYIWKSKQNYLSRKAKLNQCGYSSDKVYLKTPDGKSFEVVLSEELYLIKTHDNNIVKKIIIARYRILNSLKLTYLR